LTKRRNLGADGPSISQITYGAMRLSPAAVPDGDPVRHLCRLHDAGIDTHHSSHEYDSHGVYLEALSAARATGRRFNHIVKLSEPSFDQHRFDGARLSALIDTELKTLGAESLTSVQWLYRTPDAQDLAGRLAGMRRDRDEIAAWAEAEVTAGRIQNLSVFPYAIAFAEAAIELGLSNTPATYLNLAELESIDLLEPSDGFIALRPLAGGRLTADNPQADELVDPRAAAAALAPMTVAERAATALRFPLLHPAVTTIVVSLNGVGHLEAVLSAAADVEPNIEAFKSEVARVTDVG
jgi:aryl-alcohol dehydrogenase-like predicted oxidoreductase